MQRGPAARRRLAAVGGGGIGPLDLAPAAAAAYSLRRLSVAYTGPALDVRRSSDNAVQTIGFSGADFDLATFNAFVGAGQGFVAKWYDQSGNGNHAVQATAANQPQLVISVATLGGRPGLLFGDATSVRLNAPAAASLNNMFASANGGCVSSVFTIATTAANDRLFDRGPQTFASSGTRRMSWRQPATGAGAWTMNSDMAAGAHVYDVFYSSASLANVPVQSVDGVVQAQAATQPTGTITADTGSMDIGGSGTGASWPGHIEELIYWKDTVPGAGQIASIRANQAAYWVPSPLLLDLTTPAAAAYSLRKLSNAYAGPCVRVRRASDNAAQDIGFVGQNLDLAALQAFLGGSQGFVSTWYDQSGNGIHATQGTAANQPQIIASRAALGGMPALQWATDGGINGTVQVSTGAPATLINIWDAGAFIAHVFNIVATATANDGVIGKGAAWDPRITSGTRKYAFTRGASTTTGSWQMATDLALGAHALAISYSSASLANIPAITVDGTGQSLGTSTQPVGTLTDDSVAGLSFGQRGVAAFPGDFAEIVVWKTQTPGLAAIQANQKAYWGTP